MQITLRKFLETDLAAMEAWARAIESGKYMSNSRPATCTFGAAQAERRLLWRVISAEGKDVGSVWIEEAENHAEAVLGILLGKEALFGRGIGRAAIALILEEARAFFPFKRILLHVRTGNFRARRCYAACGFKEAGTGVKVTAGGDKIPFQMMEYLFKEDGDAAR